MDPRYARPPSPGSRRISVQPTRSSTGTLVFPSNYDPYPAPTRSSGNVASGPRSSADRVLPPRTTTTKYRPASPPLRKPSRDEYTVRPRRLTLDPEAANVRRPLSVVAPSSPNRPRPVITSSIDRPSSPLTKPVRVRQDEGYYLQPATTSSRREHHRNYSVPSTDAGRLVPVDRDARSRGERGGYRSSGIGGGRSGYNLDQPLVRQPEFREDRAPVYDFNERREQMYRDTAPRPRPRRDSYNAGGRERPMSMIGLEDYLPPRISQSNREAGPPVTTRGFDSIGRAGSVRDPRSGVSRAEVVAKDHARDDYDIQPRKARPQVALHQSPVDAHSLAARDDRDYDARHPKLAPRDPYSEPKARDPYIEPRTRDPYVDSKPRDPYVEPRARDPYIDPKPRDPYVESKPRDPYPDTKPRDPYVEPKNRDPYDDPREGAHDGRSRRHRHHRDHHRDTEHNDNRDHNRESRREERHEEKRDQGDSGRVGDAAVLGAAGLAATGLAAESIRQHRSHRDAAESIRQHRSHREKDYDAQDKTRDTDKDRLGVSQDHVERNSVRAEASDEDRKERHRRRRREREERRAREEEELRKAREIPPRDEDQRLREPDGLPIPRDPALREQASYERPSNDRRPSHERHASYERREDPSRRSHGRRHHYAHTQDKDSYSESSSSSSSDTDSFDSRPRTVRVVTPTEEPVEPKEPPKSILRPPREKFPEDPAPIREGVAPLKDAGKKGIPPNARWTKIDRKLVNPEALDLGNERYEERTDYVIVLRVLTKEEIEQYALKTQEIRGKRPTLPANAEGSFEASTRNE